MGLTLTQLKTRTARKIGDPSAQTWGTAADPNELTDYLNDALTEMCTLVPFLRKIITLSVNTTYDATRQTAFYSPAAGVTVVRFYGAWSAGRPLERSTINDEFQMVANWEDNAGTPQRIIHGDFDYDVWRVTPYPAAALTTLRAHVSYLATELAAGGDIPGIPAMWHQYLPDRAAVMAFERNGEKQDTDASKRCQERWDRAIGEAQAWASSSGDEQDLTVPMGSWY